MATFRNLIGSLQVALKQTFAGSSISLAQISFWCTLYINKARSAKIQSEDTGRYTMVFPNVPIYIPTTSTTNYIAGRKYILLPSNILDLPGDKGIVYISYNDFEGSCPPSFTGVRFTRTTQTKANRLYMSPYETPTPANPYFYLISKNIVYLLGIECINVNSLEVGLIVSFDPFTQCVLDENMDMDEAEFATVYAQVLNLGRFTMLIPSNTINDGTDKSPSTEVPKKNLTIQDTQTQQPTE